MIPKKIIDNSDVKLSTFINSVLEEIPNTQFDIATTFFNIQEVKGFRIHGGLKRCIKRIFFITNIEMIFTSGIFMTL